MVFGKVTEAAFGGNFALHGSYRHQFPLYYDTDFGQLFSKDVVSQRIFTKISLELYKKNHKVTVPLKF